MPRTVVWHCRDCDREYESVEQARACCDGDEDDLFDAYGVPYDTDGLVRCYSGP